ncbi:MAG: flagellar hook-length control protein FliK [Lachnospiraceae bacterium]|nr:flagellar hook-length control protein FliK [Lachnospiraceae bacterium]
MLNSTVINRNTPHLNTATSQVGSRSIGSINGNGGGSVRQLTTGEVIKGEVSDLRNNQVEVTLEDNTKVAAYLENASDIAIGDTAAFRVESIDANGITLKLIPKTQELLQNDTINRALTEAGLPKNETNVSVVRELIENQMPINKKMIQQILVHSYNNKDVSINTLVLMTKHNIPVTGVNASQFQEYRNYEHRLVKEVDTLTDSIPTLMEHLSQENPSEVVVSFLDHLLDILPMQESADANEIVFPTVRSILSDEQRQELVEHLENFNIPEATKQAILDGSLSLKEAYTLMEHLQKEAMAVDQNNALQIQENFLEEAATAGETPNMELLEQELMETEKVADQLSHPILDSLMEEYSLLRQDQGLLSSFMEDDALFNLKNMLTEAGFAQELIDSVDPELNGGNISSVQFLNAFKKALPEAKSDIAGFLLQSREFKDVFKAALMSNWTLRPSMLKDPESIPRLYDTLTSQMKSLHSLMEQALSGEDAAKISQQSSHLNNNIDFMNTLNQFFPYLQLPMRLHNQTLHSELYVYTKRDQLRNDPNHVSVLLHLDMDYLGPLDIHIKMDEKNVNARFSTTSDEIKTLLNANLPFLAETLQNRGYTFNGEAVAEDESVDIVKDFMEAGVKDTGMKRYSFDIRA